MLLDNIIHFPEFKCSLFAYRSYINIFDPGVSSELHTHIPNTWLLHSVISQTCPNVQAWDWIASTINRCCWSVS